MLINLSEYENLAWLYLILARSVNICHFFTFDSGFSLRERIAFSLRGKFAFSLRGKNILSSAISIDYTYCNGFSGAYRMCENGMRFVDVNRLRIARHMENLK